MSERSRKLLVVDDEAFNRDILEEMLLGAGYAVITAVDGEDAWSTLDGGQHVFSAVLLDRMMPRLDGMGLLARMKADKRFAELPVIFQTAIDSPEDIAAGIQAGAFYYLVKPVNENVLFAIVQSAVNSFVQTADKQEVDHYALATLVQRCEYTLRTLQEARSLAIALSGFYPNPQRAYFGILELLVNAVEHGNLAISYQDKSSLLQQGSWEREILQRLELPEYADRKVHVLLEHKGNELRLTIADEGKGFDSAKYLTISAERAFDPNGRGIAMSRMTSFDTLEYIGCGNKVLATLKI